MPSPVSVKVSSTKEVDGLLSRLEIDMRERTLKAAIRKAGRVVEKEAKRRAPKPGYPGDKPGKTPLNETIKTKVVSFRNGSVLGMVGPRRPDGAHGHLVEFGHRKVLWGRETNERVRPYPFMRPAADTTKTAQQAAVVNHLRSDLQKVRSV